MIKCETTDEKVCVLLDGNGKELTCELMAIIDAIISHFTKKGAPELGGLLVLTAVASSDAMEYVKNRIDGPFVSAEYGGKPVDISDLLKAAREEAEGK